MKREVELIVAQAVVWALSAVFLICVPSTFAAFFGLGLDPGGILVARLMGAELTALAIVSFVTRSAAPQSRWFSAAYFLSNSLGTLFCLLAVLAGVLNGAGWLLVALYLFYAAGFGIVALRSSKGS